MGIINSHRRAGALLLGSVLGFAVVITTLVPGLTPWSPSAADAMAKLDQVSQSCAVSYGALDPTNQNVLNPDKEVPAAIGPRVTPRDEAGIKADLQERRTCGTDGKFDPELTATHYSDWSAKGLTSRKVDYASIDAFRAEMVADPALYAATQLELTNLENASAFSIKDVSAGIWSVYMKATGDGNLTTHLGRTVHDGTAATFTHPGGAVVQYRLECGYQVVHSSPPAGYTVCDYDECNTPPAPPVTPPTTPPTPVCPPEMPHGTPPNCKDTPASDPWVNGNAPVGGGPNADPGPGTYQPVAPAQPPAAPYVPPAAPAPVITPAPVVTPIVPSTPAAPPVVDPGPQNNNGTVPVAPAPGTACNPVFQDC